MIDLYFNDGSATFTHRTAVGGVGPRKMALADLDGDDDLDIAMSSGLSEEVMSVVLNKGDGTFGPQRSYDVGPRPNGIAAGDFDRDGDLDLALAQDDLDTGLTKIQIWRNNGAAKFKLVAVVALTQRGDPSSMPPTSTATERSTSRSGSSGPRPTSC